MNKNKYVFAQLVEFLDKDKFRHLVDKLTNIMAIGMSSHSRAGTNFLH